MSEKVLLLSVTILAMAPKSYGKNPRSHYRKLSYVRKKDVPPLNFLRLDADVRELIYGHRFPMIVDHKVPGEWPASIVSYAPFSQWRHRHQQAYLFEACEGLAMSCSTIYHEFVAYIGAGIVWHVALGIQHNFDALSMLAPRQAEHLKYVYLDLTLHQPLSTTSSYANWAWIAKLPSLAMLQVSLTITPPSPPMGYRRQARGPSPPRRRIGQALSPIRPGARALFLAQTTNASSIILSGILAELVGCIPTDLKTIWTRRGTSERVSEWASQ